MRNYGQRMRSQRILAKRLGIEKNNMIWVSTQYFMADFRPYIFICYPTQIIFLMWIVHIHQQPPCYSMRQENPFNFEAAFESRNNIVFGCFRKILAGQAVLILP